MITITAMRWVPSFARGQVRDLRLRWALREVGLPYAVRILDRGEQTGAAYRALQPFGQVPVLEEDGVAQFETGAIVLGLAGRGGGLLPAEEPARARAVCWLFAALNSVEPFLANLAECDFLLRDEELKARRRPGVLRMAQRRLGELEAALGGRDYLTEGFTAADLMMTTVLRIVGHTDLVAGLPALAAYQARCEGRPAFGQALAEQLADFAAAPGPG